MPDFDFASEKSGKAFGNIYLDEANAAKVGWVLGSDYWLGKSQKNTLAKIVQDWANGRSDQLSHASIKQTAGNDGVF